MPEGTQNAAVEGLPNRGLWGTPQHTLPGAPLACKGEGVRLGGLRGRCWKAMVPPGHFQPLYFHIFPPTPQPTTSEQEDVRVAEPLWVPRCLPRGQTLAANAIRFMAPLPSPGF